MSKTPEKSRFRRYVRGLFTLCLFLGLILGIGSIFMRQAVIKRLSSRAMTSSGLVLGRPIAIVEGESFSKLNLESRLKRMGYVSISGELKRPGEFHKNLPAGRFDIYPRGFSISDTVKQPSVPYHIQIAPNGEIAAIKDRRFGRRKSHIWLEPEMLSALGNSDTRAVSPKRLSEFSEHLVNAVIAIEDERFYQHFGLDFLAILRATVVNIRARKIVQGGSTLTQQLAKNLFLTRERTIVRKIVEAFSSVLIETAFTKDQILEFYMNEIFLAQEGRVAVHGFGEAARSFFNKDVSKLSLAQAAILAGMIKAPSRYSPRRNPESTKNRAITVLKKMKELGFVGSEEYKQAIKEPLRVVKASRSRRVAPYFIDYVRRAIPEVIDPGLLSDGRVRVHTGLDLEYQKCAEKAVTQGLKDLAANYGHIKRSKEKVQAALVAISPTDASVISWVGGRNFSNSQFDRVSQAKRQPGSAFKPFVYLTALDDKLNSYRVARTTSVLLDEAITLEIPGSDDWTPKNYDRKYRGEVTLREALTYSLNIPTVNLARKIGIRSIANTAELFGFGDDLPRVPSLALGAGEVTPLELSRAYNSLANGGRLLNLRPILSISKADDKDFYYESPIEQTALVSEPAVFVLNNILRSVIENGTGKVVRRMGLKIPVAGKTGTSNDSRDSWFAGFSPHLLAVAWVGYDSGKPLKLTGSQAAAPIWTRYMLCASQMEPELDFLAPPGIVYRDVDVRTGLLDDGYCSSDRVVREVYVEGTEPLVESPCKPLPGRRYGTEPYQRRRSARGSGRSRSRNIAEDLVSSVIKALLGR